MKSFTKHRTLVRKKVYQPNRHKQYTHYEIELILFLQTQWKLYYYCISSCTGRSYCRSYRKSIKNY